MLCAARFYTKDATKIVMQRAREVLEQFQFTVAPQPGFMVHCNRKGSKLQLQVDIFCSDFVAGGDAWVQQVGTRRDVQARMLSLLRIYDVNGRPIT